MACFLLKEPSLLELFQAGTNPQKRTIGTTEASVYWPDAHPADKPTVSKP